MFLQPDGTFWIQLLNFVIFFALLNVVFLRPVSAAIRKRREYINSVTSDYEAYTGEAATLQAHAEATRAAARREAEQMLAKARAQISNETAALSTEYGAKAMQTVEAAHETVRSELQAARANENATIEELAALMVDRTMSESSR